MTRERKPTARAMAGAITLAGGAFRTRAGAPTRRLPSLAELLALEAERRRFFVWLPVCFGLGILLYFAADREPSLWAPLAGALTCAFGAALARTHWRLQAIAIALAMIFAGFTAAVVRTASAEAPILPRLMTGALTGFVEAVEERANGARIVVVPTSFARLEAPALPARVRVTVREENAVKPGDFITATARLLPPPEPARPGGYDFARDAFFHKIGAVGSISGAITIGAPPAPTPWRLSLDAKIDWARNVLTDRIVRAFGGQAGAVAAALVTGKRGLIAEGTNEALRAAGIYHIVSISGLHMVLAAGTFFWTARALLALVPAIALGLPVKKIAAVIAMIGATGYCIFSGSEVATERSLVMTLVMLGAILFDRPALSMRNLALAALIVLAREPESLLGPSFQMSFAAVAGLIAFCERPLREPAEARAPLGPVLRLARSAWRAAVVMIATTCVATIATSPFSAYHFQTLNPLGILGNALALPLMSLIVMPLAVIGVVAYPFGLDTPIWWLMSLGTQPVLLAAHAVASIERSSVVVPALGGLALGLMVLGLLWITLWSTALRWLAVVPAALGVALAASPERADLMIDRAAAGAAVRGVDGRLALLGKPSDFVTEQWLRADGDGRKATDPSLRAGTACDRLGCVAKLPDGRAVALVNDKLAFSEDCRRAAIIISRHQATATCQASVVLDRSVLAQAGSAAVAIRNGALVVTPARHPTARRPWLTTVAPGVARDTPAVAAKRSGPRPSTPAQGDAEIDEKLIQ